MDFFSLGPNFQRAWRTWPQSRRRSSGCRSQTKGGEEEGDWREEKGRRKEKERKEE